MMRLAFVYSFKSQIYQKTYKYCPYYTISKEEIICKSYLKKSSKDFNKYL